MLITAAVLATKPRRTHLFHRRHHRRESIEAVNIKAESRVSCLVHTALALRCAAHGRRANRRGRCRGGCAPPPANGCAISPRRAGRTHRQARHGQVSIQCRRYVHGKRRPRQDMAKHLASTVAICVELATPRCSSKDALSETLCSAPMPRFGWLRRPGGAGRPLEIKCHPTARHWSHRLTRAQTRTIRTHDVTPHSTPPPTPPPYTLQLHSTPAALHTIALPLHTRIRLRIRRSTGSCGRCFPHQIQAVTILQPPVAQQALVAAPARCSHHHCAIAYHRS